MGTISNEQKNFSSPKLSPPMSYNMFFSPRVFTDCERLYHVVIAVGVSVFRRILDATSTYNTRHFSSHIQWIFLLWEFFARIRRVNFMNTFLGEKQLDESDYFLASN